MRERRRTPRRWRPSPSRRARRDRRRRSRAVASMFTPVTGASASDRWRLATATASPYMTPAASRVAASVHMTPAASTIGQSARERRRLTRRRAASDEIKLRRLPGRSWGRSPRSIPRVALGRVRDGPGSIQPAYGILHTGRMSVGTAFHPRTSPLNRKMQWREWSGLLRVERLRGRPRHRIQRDPRGRGTHRRVAALQVPRLRARRPAPRRPGRHPRRDQAVGRWRHLHAVVRRARQGRRRRHGPSPRRAALPLDRRRPAAPLAPPEQRRPRRRPSPRRPRRPPRSRSRARCHATCSRRRPANRSTTCATSGDARPRSARSRSTSRGPATPATSATSCGSRPTARSRSGTR